MWTQKGPSQESILQRCLYYSQTSLIWTLKGQSQVYANVLNTDTKRTETSVCTTEVSVLQSTLLNTDTKGTEPSVCITEVSVLQSNLLYTDTKGTEPSVYITEVSVVQSNPLNSGVH